MNDITNSPYGALISACALATIMCALIIWRTSMGARARAQERARIWGALIAPELEARAERKRAERASGARQRARIRGALMIAVALVALGATNLSAHGTLDMIARAGLESLDAQIAVIVVFEMFLAILGALSYWHMHHGNGFNKYEAGVWAMASLMGAMSWWGSGSAVFALWPILAAVAWHLVITFGREHKQSAVITWWRLKRGKATSQDANAVMTERMITRIVNHAYLANTSARTFMRAHHERAYDRAWARADALGILTPEVRARIQTRIAARYAGARALAPEAVAHMNPWNERASMSARTPRTERARIARPVSAPPAHADEVSAHVPDDARALESVRNEERAQDAPDMRALIERCIKHVDARVFTLEKWEKQGKIASGDELAEVTGLSAGNCRRWIAPLNAALRDA